MEAAFHDSDKGVIDPVNRIRVLIHQGSSKSAGSSSGDLTAAAAMGSRILGVADAMMEAEDSPENIEKMISKNAAIFANPQDPARIIEIFDALSSCTSFNYEKCLLQIIDAVGDFSAFSDENKSDLMNRYANCRFISALQKLIEEQGFNPNYRNGYGKNAFITAAEQQSLSNEKDVELRPAQTMLESGAMRGFTDPVLVHFINYAIDAGLLNPKLLADKMEEFSGRSGSDMGRIAPAFVRVLGDVGLINPIIDSYCARYGIEEGVLTKAIENFMAEDANRNTAVASGGVASDLDMEEISKVREAIRGYANQLESRFRPTRVSSTADAAGIMFRVGSLDSVDRDEEGDMVSPAAMAPTLPSAAGVFAAPAPAVDHPHHVVVKAKSGCCTIL